MREELWLFNGETKTRHASFPILIKFVPMLQFENIALAYPK